MNFILTGQYLLSPLFKYVKKSDKSGGNPGVGYHFLVLNQQESSSAGFKWVTGAWSACSRTCAVGKVFKSYMQLLIEVDMALSNDQNISIMLK